MGSYVSTLHAYSKHVALFSGKRQDGCVAMRELHFCSYDMELLPTNTQGLAAVQAMPSPLPLSPSLWI